ncbi:carboxylating nicotinate-nucleotide diphosphorylase [Balneolales bacterium ANBcel1]|nr:carboxylating nicotinate-nucleotide diphosphorylase [Balneolales bacterium ANBcel1]
MQKWPDEVKKLVRLALDEDLGAGDITTNAIYSGSETGSARIVSREDGVLAGVNLAGYILAQVSSDVKFTPLLRDGEPLGNGVEIARIEGPLAPILSAERTILNFMQRMSGIATRTCAFTRSLASTRTRILDTRKTAPGHRYLDKMAVRIGGGNNHRMRLDDRFLIKENHIRMAGGIERAIDLCLDYRKQNRLDAAIEIEVSSLEELDQVIAHGGVEYVMLDNMSLEMVKAAVIRVDRRFLLEASGNVTLENLAAIGETGVDFISSGALTHSVPAMDISLLVDGASVR